MRFSKVCRKVLTIGQITSGLNPWRGFSVLVLLIILDHSFLSFDFHDSRNTVLRGVDEAGRIVGYSRPFGSTNAHAFLATLTEDR
jgi:hypothetical protein